MKIIGRGGFTPEYFHGVPEIVAVPMRVAVCPECRGRLLVQVNGCEAGTGMLHEDDMIEVDCEREPDPDDPDYADKAHRWWQGEWMPTLDAVRRWAKKNLKAERNTDE